jgi:4-amino-4-deoxy-L-arabinose transferase-like glycosyltransferase
MDDSVYATLGFQLAHFPTNYSSEILYQTIDKFYDHAMEYLNRPMFKHPPLYPMVLAISYRLFGGHIFAALIPSLISWAGICLLTRKIGMKLFGSTVGSLAFLMCLLDPVGWALSQMIYAECLLTCLILLGVWFYLEKSPTGSLVPCAIALALACLTKYSALIIVLVLCVHMGISHQPKRIVSFLIPFSLILTPWIGVQIYLYHVHFWGMMMEDYFVRSSFLAALLVLGFVVVCAKVLFRYLDRISFRDNPRSPLFFRGVPFLLMALPFVWFIERTLGIFLWGCLPVTTFWRHFPNSTGFIYWQPLYFLPFLAFVPFFPLFRLKKDNQSGPGLLLLLVMVTFGVTGFWHNPLTRYLYPVLPIAILLATSTALAMWKRSFSLSPWVGISARGTLIALCLFFLAKTLRNDWFFGFVNLAGKF